MDSFIGNLLCLRVPFKNFYLEFEEKRNFKTEWSWKGIILKERYMIRESFKKIDDGKENK